MYKNKDDKIQAKNFAAEQNAKDKTSKEKHILNPSEDSLRDSLIMALAKDYDLIYLSNLDTGRNLYGYKTGDAEIKDFTDEDFQQLEEFNSEELHEFQRKVLHPDDFDYFMENITPDAIAKHFETMDGFKVRYRVRYDASIPDYQFYETIFAKTTNYDKTHNYVAALHSIDDIVKAEREKSKQLEELLLKAESANKQKDEFIFNMSHDLHTPLNAIMGFINIAKEYIDKDGGKVLEYLNKAESSGKHFMGIIEDILNLSINSEEGRKIVIETVSLRDFAENTMSMISLDMSKKNLVLTTNVDEGCDEFIKIDSVHLGQALVNLLKNSANFTDEGGHIELNITQKPSENPDKGIFTFVVKDDGIGMSEEIAAHAFDPFVRGQTTTESGILGVGIGLTTTKTLIEAMGGRIWLESAPEQGTSVFVELEAEINKAVGKISEAAHYPYDALSGKNVLVVEDNEINAEIESHFLEEWGINTQIAEDGKVAIDLIKAQKVPYDAILMDIQMPNMDGYEATRTIRTMEGNVNAFVPIIAVTANSTDADKEKAFEAGMNDHVGKPVIPITLFDTICKNLSIPPKAEE